MFSPEAQSLAARNPRRRARQTSDESPATRPSNKRRKRSVLSQEVFEPLTNGHAKLPNGNHKDTASPEVRSLRSASIETTAAQGQQLTHRSRGSKRGDKKGSKREAGVLQADTDHYSVWKESELPPTLKEVLGLSQQQQTNGHTEPHDAEPWRADLSTKLGYAVAFTRKQAIVWPYSQGTPNFDPSKVLTIQLPFQSSSRASRETLPLGALVHDTGAGELGLLAVAPSSGKLVYWESVASAANAGAIRQKQHGAHGAVSGLYSGESVIAVTEAEPDSFIVSTSYGRIAHVSVRDLQGRPQISSNILRGASDNNGSGLFGSFKNVFSSAAWRKDIAAVRAGPMRGKSGRQCIAAYANGRIQAWNLERHAAKILDSEVEAGATIHNAISVVHPDRANHGHELRILDFTYFSKPREGRPNSPRILLLCGYAAGANMFYYLVDATLQLSEWEVQVVHPISCWSTPPATRPDGVQEKLTVLLPDPGHTAYVTGSKHIVLVSLVEIEQTPDAQLQMEAETISEPFQDVLRLNTKRNHDLLACGVDSTDRNPEKASCIMLVENFGFARASATPVTETETSWDRRAYLCRSHIEQGVFFGSNPDNLLDFSSTLDKGSWTNEEIEASAIAVNDAIVENKSKRIPQMTPSMEQQLQTRALWLRELINYVKFTRLSHRGRWHLLWTAEKIATAEALWLSYSELLRTKAPREKLLLPELLDMISEQYKHENNPDLGETDIVRHYLLNDVAGIEILIPWADKAVESLEEDGFIRRPDQEGKLMRQASDIIIVGLSTAFDFRARNCQAYGITPDLVEDGIYQGDYGNLPYFWTSAPESPEQVRRHAENVCALVVKHNALMSPRDGMPEMPDSLLGMIASDAPVLIETCCRVYEERCRWLTAQSNDEERHAGETLRARFVKIRKHLLLRAQELELDEDAFRLAEYYGDMDALAEMLARAYDGLLTMGSTRGSDEDDEELDMARRRLAQLDKRTAHYFAAYGENFAAAAYDRRIEAGQLSDLLAKDSDYRDHLTRYLRRRPQLRKLSWINDALLTDFDRAADDLVACSKKDELLWARKIDLSLAKLSAMAAQETIATATKDDSDAKPQETNKLDRRLALVSIQEELYAYTRPFLQGAIDVIAEVDLAMESFGAFARGKPFLEGQLRAAFEKLSAGRALDADELIDCLTLLTPPADQRDLDESGRAFERDRFFTALRLLDLKGWSGTRRELAEKIVWRRCLLQDDWSVLNRTEAKTDEAVMEAASGTALFATARAGYKDGLLDAYPPLTLAVVQGAGTTPDALRESAEYAGAPDDVLVALAADLALEDAALDAVAKKGRLEMWWSGVVNAAQIAVRREMDEEGERKAAHDEARRAFERETGEVYDRQGDTPTTR